MGMCTLARALRLCVAAVIPTVSGLAQRLIVDVRDSARQSGVVGALVSAIEQTSGTKVYGVTNDDGRAALALRRGGTWVTSVRRIGIVPARAAGVAVEAGQTVYVTVNTTMAQFRLPAVNVTASAPACAREPEGDGRAAVLWEQITLALRASALSARAPRDDDALHVIMFERELARDLTRRAERATREGPGVGRPFFAAHPDTLTARGYVQRDPSGSLQYFAPDETVMLSDGFIRTHCFDAPASSADAALAELRFAPIRGRSLPDVAGTAFVDTTTGELRRIEFRFVNVDRFFEGRRPDAGGEVAMRRLDDGRWIVSGWTIRMPTYMRVPGRVERSLLGYREVGGTIRVLSRAAAVDSVMRDTVAVRNDSLRLGQSSERKPQRRRTSARDVERRSGFAMRRTGGPGTFLDSTELARTPHQTALQLLQHVSGVTMFSVPYDVPAVPAEPDPDLAREWRAGAELPMMSTGVRTDGGQDVCLIKVYLDGARAGLAQLAALAARNVVALEFYRLPTDVPSAYRREGNQCGTAMFWSFGDR